MLSSGEILNITNYGIFYPLENVAIYYLQKSNHKIYIRIQLDLNYNKCSFLWIISHYIISFLSDLS